MERERLSKPHRGTSWGVGGSSEMGCIGRVRVGLGMRRCDSSEREAENQCGSVLCGLEVKRTENGSFFFSSSSFLELEVLVNLY